MMGKKLSRENSTIRSEGLVALLTSSLLLTYPEITLAQITPDNTLGVESSIVSPEITINDIPSNAINGGALRESNLFHSFEDFNIDEGRGVYFTNPAGVENIFSRVTGSNSSNIQGVLGVLDGNANLFLLNPNGIVFGPNSSLDVRGSFMGTTANSIDFIDGGSFSVEEPENIATLTVSIPIGIRLNQDSGRIRVQRARLVTEPGQTFSLLGGSLDLQDGFLSSPGGRIELGSVTGSGRVQATLSGGSISLDYTDIDPLDFGEINLSRGALVRASEPNGSIVVQAGQLSIQDGSQISVTTFGEGDAGNLLVNASDSINIEGRDRNGFSSGLLARVDESGNGQGGAIIVNTRELSIRDGGTITTSSGGIGNAGIIEITASDKVEIAGEEFLRLFRTTIDNVSYTFSVPDTVSSTILSRVEGDGTGNAGNISIATNSLLIRSGYISTSSISQGNAGNITLTVTDDINLNSGSIFSQANQSDFAAGEIRLTADSLSLNSGQVYAESASSTGGNIFLDIANDIFLREGSLITATAGRDELTGSGGNIAIETSFLIANPAENSDVTAQGSQQGGRIRIEALEIFGIQPTESLTENSDISVSSLQDNFGIDGELIIDTPPELEPVRELTELPDVLVVSDDSLISRGCYSLNRIQDGGNFVIRNENRGTVTDFGEPSVNDTSMLVDSFVSETFEADQISFHEDGSIQFRSSQSLHNTIDHDNCK